MTPEYALWDIPLFFQIEAKDLTCREQLQAKQLRVAEIDDEDTVYGMLCTGGLVHKHIT